MRQIELKSWIKKNQTQCVGFSKIKHKTCRELSYAKFDNRSMKWSPVPWKISSNQVQRHFLKSSSIGLGGMSNDNNKKIELRRCERSEPQRKRCQRRV